MTEAGKNWIKRRMTYAIRMQVNVSTQVGNAFRNYADWLGAPIQMSFKWAWIYLVYSAYMTSMFFSSPMINCCVFLATVCALQLAYLWPRQWIARDSNIDNVGGTNMGEREGLIASLEGRSESIESTGEPDYSYNIHLKTIVAFILGMTQVAVYFIVSLTFPFNRHPEGTIMAFFHVLFFFYFAMRSAFHE